MLKATGEKKEKRARDEKSEEKGPDGVESPGRRGKKEAAGAGHSQATWAGGTGFCSGRLCVLVLPAIVPFVSGGRWGISAADLAWPTAKRPQRALATAVHGAKAAQGAKIAAKLELLGIS